MEDILVPAIVFGSAVMIVALSLLYYYLKEKIRTKERLTAIEKGISPKDIYPEFQNDKQMAISKRESEIYGGVKIFIIGLFLALAIYISSGADSFSLKGAIWGIFVSGIGLAKIFVGLMMKKHKEEN